MRLKHLLSVFLTLLTLSVGQMWGAPITVNQVTTTSGTYTIACAQGTGQNAPADQGDFIRCYANNTITISTTGSNMTEIVIAWTKNSSKAFASVTASPGSYTHPSAAGNGTWTGNANSVTFTVGSSGQIQITTVTITEASSKTLSSISVQTAPTKKKYVAGEMFDPTGLVITRTYSDKTSDTYAYAGHTSDFTFSPTTSTALTTSNTSVSITYGGKSTSQAINVYNVTMQARDEDGNTIPSGGPGAPSRTGKSISPANDANNYVFKQWQVTNADLGSSATTKANTITNPTGAVTVTAVYYKPIPVSWNKNGSLYATTYTGYNQKPVFPSNPSSCDATSNTFYGWATGTWDGPVDNLTGKTVYTSADDMPNVTSAGTTYNAVFAKGTDSSTPANFTSTFTSNSWGDANSLWDSGKAGNQLTSGRGIQITTGASGANATTKSSYSNVTSVVVTYSTNASSGAGSISITVGGTGTTASGSVSTSGGTTDRTITYTPTSPATSLTGKVQITATCSTNSIYIKSVQVNYSTGGTTYSKYRTLCCTPLASINGSFFRCHFLGRNLEFSSYHYVKGRFAHF